MPKETRMEERENNYKAWLYLAPVLILMAVFTFYPIVNTIVVSFLKDYNATTGSHSGFSFYNYAYILGFAERYEGSGVYNRVFFSFEGPSAFWNTMFITFVTVPISVIIALLISIAIHNIKALQKFFQTVFFMPYVTNVIAVGMVFSIIFSNGGVFNNIFRLSVNWINPTSATWATCMTVLCVYIIWTALPYKILIFLSGLQGIDKRYFDAARIDGASKAKANLKIIVPLLSPQILYISVTSFITAFKEYGAIVGLLNRSYSSTAVASKNDLFTIVYYIYDMISSSNWSLSAQYGSAAAVILLVVILLFTILELRISKKMVVY